VQVVHRGRTRSVMSCWSPLRSSVRYRRIGVGSASQRRNDLCGSGRYSTERCISAQRRGIPSIPKRKHTRQSTGFATTTGLVPSYERSERDDKDRGKQPPDCDKNPAKVLRYPAPTLLRVRAPSALLTEVDDWQHDIGAVDCRIETGICSVSGPESVRSARSPVVIHEATRIPAGGVTASGALSTLSNDGLSHSIGQPIGTSRAAGAALRSRRSGLHPRRGAVRANRQIRRTDSPIRATGQTVTGAASPVHAGVPAIL
jgi:hypothetical protein